VWASHSSLSQNSVYLVAPPQPLAFMKNQTDKSHRTHIRSHDCKSNLFITPFFGSRRARPKEERVSQKRTILVSRAVGIPETLHLLSYSSPLGARGALESVPIMRRLKGGCRPLVAVHGEPKSDEKHDSTVIEGGGRARGRSCVRQRPKCDSTKEPGPKNASQRGGAAGRWLRKCSGMHVGWIGWD
jgi:hypothetical protein